MPKNGCFAIYKNAKNSDFIIQKVMKTAQNSQKHNTFI